MLGLGFGVFFLGCYLLWVVNALNLPIIAKASKEEEVLQEDKKAIARSTGKPRQTQSEAW